MTQRRDSSPRSQTERSEHDSCLCWPWDGNLTVVGLFRDMLLFDIALSFGLAYFAIDGLPLTLCNGESLPWCCIASVSRSFVQEAFVEPYHAMPSVEGYTVVTSEAFGSWLLGILMLPVVVCGITFGNLFLLIIVGFPGFLLCLGSLVPLIYTLYYLFKGMAGVLRSPSCLTARTIASLAHIPLPSLLLALLPLAHVRLAPHVSLFVHTYLVTASLIVWINWQKDSGRSRAD